MKFDIFIEAEKRFFLKTRLKVNKQWVKKSNCFLIIKNNFHC
jgi:hypothetical protein